jgi:hypothetical protein
LHSNFEALFPHIPGPLKDTSNSKLFLDREQADEPGQPALEPG